MSKFKVGDLVENRVGQRYEIEHVVTYRRGDGDDVVYIFKDTNGLQNYNGHHLKLIIPAEKRLKPFPKAAKEIVDNHIDKIYKENGCYERDDEPKKYDSDKPRMDLIRPEFTLALGECLGYGATKYDEPRGDTPNYLKGDGFNYSTIIASLERHIAAFKMGQDVDDESNLSHLAHAAVNLMFLHTYSLCDKGVDDRVVLGGKNESKDKKVT